MSIGLLLASFLVAIVLLALVARKIGVAYPVVFVIGGAALALVPGVPKIELAPDLVFLLFLPPLIFGDGWQTDVRAFMRDARIIVILAVGLVLASAIAVAYGAHAFIGLPLAIGFVLGAMLAPTDAVATEAIASELRIPARTAAILSGESLVNDASSLVIYAFAIAAVTTGAFSLGAAVLRFVYVVGVGLGVGIGGALLLSRLVARLRASELSDELIMVSISLASPFAFYVAADALGASGVLAAMSAGMMLSRSAGTIFDAESRIAASAVWGLLFFTFNGAAFVLIGLQLRTVAPALGRYPLASLAGWALTITAIVVATRYAWFLVVPAAGRALVPGFSRRDGPTPSLRVLLMMGTAGMRGVISLAAALALPRDFPDRALLLFIVFVVILVTLVGQGLLLPIAIRRFDLVETSDALERSLELARVRVAEAARYHLDELVASDPETAGAAAFSSANTKGAWRGSARETSSPRAMAAMPSSSPRTTASAKRRSRPSASRSTSCCTRVRSMTSRSDSCETRSIAQSCCGEMKRERRPESSGLMLALLAVMEWTTRRKRSRPRALRDRCPAGRRRHVASLPRDDEERNGRHAQAHMSYQHHCHFNRLTVDVDASGAAKLTSPTPTSARTRAQAIGSRLRSGRNGRPPYCPMTSAAAKLPSRPHSSSGAWAARPYRKPAA